MAEPGPDCGQNCLLVDPDDGHTRRWTVSLLVTSCPLTISYFTQNSHHEAKSRRYSYLNTEIHIQLHVLDTSSIMQKNNNMIVL